MSKRNYTNYSKPNKPHFEPVDNVESVDQVTEAEVVEDVSENSIVPEAPKHIPAIVSGCKKLNVRERPNANAEVVCIIDVDSEVVITEVNLEGWYKICTTSGAEGYCIVQFIKPK